MSELVSQSVCLSVCLAHVGSIWLTNQCQPIIDVLSIDKTCRTVMSSSSSSTSFYKLLQASTSFLLLVYCETSQLYDKDYVTRKQECATIRASHKPIAIKLSSDVKLKVSLILSLPYLSY